MDRSERESAAPDDTRREPTSPPKANKASQEQGLRSFVVHGGSQLPGAAPERNRRPADGQNLCGGRQGRAVRRPHQADAEIPGNVLRRGLRAPVNVALLAEMPGR
jgi:hypothetical protein